MDGMTTVDDNEPMSEEQAGKAFLTLRLMHGGLVAGVLALGLVIVLLVHKNMTIAPPEEAVVMLVVNVVIWFGSLCASVAIGFLWRKFNSPPATPRAAFRQYQSFCLTRWGLIESGAMISAVMILMTRNVVPVGYLAISLAVLLYRRPSLKELSSFSERKPGASAGV